MKLTIDIPDEKIANVLCSALEGGIRYWARVESSSHTRTYVPLYELPLVKGGWVKLKLLETAKEAPRTLNRLTIEQAVRLMAEKYPYHYAALVGQIYDHTTGDVLVQLACFGTLIFG